MVLLTLNMKIMKMKCQQNYIIQMILIIILMNLHIVLNLYILWFLWIYIAL